MYNKKIYTGSNYITDQVIVFDIHPHFLFWESLFEDPEGIDKFLHYTHNYEISQNN